MSQPGPLAGITVVDLTRVLSGPFCTMHLADMGARVIKVERPGEGDDTRAWGPPFLGAESAYFLGPNRNKESVTLDFKHPGGRRILEQLIARADVLVENFRPGTLSRIGLDYPSLRPRHPRLVYASISGFGQTGPRRNETGYDAVAQAEGGLMSVIGDPDGPRYRVGVAIADLIAGLLGAQGVVLALYARERSGEGQYVDVGMLDGIVSILSHHASSFLATGLRPVRLGNGHATIAPYDTFPASDGDFFLAVGNDEQFRRFCAVTGLLDLTEDPAFATNPARVGNRAVLRQRLLPLLTSRPRAHWIEALNRAGVPCGEVRELPEVFADPQVLAREMVQSVIHATAGVVKVLGVPIKLSGTPGSVRTAPPTLGQHTAAVLREIGYDDEAVVRLRREGAI